ncbi:MAG: hypothetical protein Kow0029_04010 [Candidatus Rifleibacteriota bacterium]
MRKLVLSVLLFFLFSSVSFCFGGDVGQFISQLSEIKDARLRKTLENSIVAGLISTPEEFACAVDRAEAIANNHSAFHYSARGFDLSAVRREIQKKASLIKGLDKDAVKVEKFEGYKAGRLFKDIAASLPKSYDRAYKLCMKFDPRSGTNDAKRLDKDIDAFLASIENDPVIVHALKSTSTSIKDLKKNWFGSGLGFEHVIAGEIKGSKVSGYHWWYRFYRDEREARAEVLSAMSGIGNDNVFTGSFYWDPDGKNGPLPNARKPKGGFLVGNSVQAILALGHIAMETAKKYGKVPGAMTFRANINGEEFNWQLYTMGGSIRSLYPLGNGKIDMNSGGESNYYELEGEIAEATTVH